MLFFSFLFVCLFVFLILFYKECHLFDFRPVQDVCQQFQGYLWKTDEFHSVYDQLHLTEIGIVKTVTNLTVQLTISQHSYNSLISNSFYTNLLKTMSYQESYVQGIHMMTKMLFYLCVRVCVLFFKLVFNIRITKIQLHVYVGNAIVILMYNVIMYVQ